MSTSYHVITLEALGQYAGDRFQHALHNLPSGATRRAWVNANLLRSWWSLAACSPELLQETFAEFERLVDTFVDPSGPGAEWDNRRKGLCQ